MKDLTYSYPDDRSERYAMINRQLEALTEDEKLVIPNLANAAALLYEAMENINWAGFYLLREETLILGPYQGRPACIRIPVGKGVCGTAVKEDRTQCVPDVEAFAGHIACDSRSRSEIVIPIRSGVRIMGVLDIDSPQTGNFGPADAEGLENFVRILEKNCSWEQFSIC